MEEAGVVKFRVERRNFLALLSKVSKVAVTFLPWVASPVVLNALTVVATVRLSLAVVLVLALVAEVGVLAAARFPRRGPVVRTGVLVIIFRDLNICARLELVLGTPLGGLATQPDAAIWTRQAGWNLNLGLLDRFFLKALKSLRQVEKWPSVLIQKFKIESTSMRITKMPGHCQWAASKDGCLDVALVHSTWHFSPESVQKV